MDSVLASHPAAPVSILGISLDVAEIKSTAALLSIKWTVQKLNNVDRTHLVQLDSATKKVNSVILNFPLALELHLC